MSRRKCYKISGGNLQKMRIGGQNGKCMNGKEHGHSPLMVTPHFLRIGIATRRQI